MFFSSMHPLSDYPQTYELADHTQHEFPSNMRYWPYAPGSSQKPLSRSDCSSQSIYSIYTYTNSSHAPQHRHPRTSRQAGNGQLTTHPPGSSLESIHSLRDYIPRWLYFLPKLLLNSDYTGEQPVVPTLYGNSYIGKSLSGSWESH